MCDTWTVSVMSLAVINSSTLRALLDTDLSEYQNQQALRTFIAAVIGALEDNEASLGALRKELHSARAEKNLRGPVADAINILQTLPPSMAHQVFTAHANSIVDNATQVLSDAREHVAKAAVIANAGRHNAHAALHAGLEGPGVEHVKTIAALPGVPLLGTAIEPFDDLSEVDWFCAPTSGELDDLFGDDEGDADD